MAPTGRPFLARRKKTFGHHGQQRCGQTQCLHDEVRPIFLTSGLVPIMQVVIVVVVVGRGREAGSPRIGSDQIRFVLPVIAQRGRSRAPRGTGQYRRLVINGITTACITDWKGRLPPHPLSSVYKLLNLTQ